MDIDHVTFAFALFGEVLEPRAGVVAVDVGSICVGGVIDHHFAEAEDECAATLVVKRGEELVLKHLREAPGDGLTIVVHREPDLDAVVAAYLVVALVQDGRLSPRAKALAEYARVVDAGKPPPDGLGPTSLWALYAATAHLISSEPEEPADEFEQYCAWMHRGFELLDLALDSSPEKSVELCLPKSLTGWEKEQAFLLNERIRYVADKKAAETFTISLPVHGGEWERDVSAMRINNPRSVLFSRFAQAEGFEMTHVIREGQDASDEGASPERHLISVLPERGVWLRGLGAALERSEAEARAEMGFLRPLPPRWPDVTNSDPWYDGRAPIHGYTVVDIPDCGTVLTSEEVCRIVDDTASWIPLGRPVHMLICPRGCRYPKKTGASYCPFHADKLMPGLVDGRYEILDLIGEGGMGAIWRVKDSRTSKLYALKRLLQQFMGDEEIWNRFRREASLASRVAHPNIVRLIYFGTSAETGPYTVSEYIEGTNLRADIAAFQETRAWYPWPRLLSVLTQVCRALAAVHHAGVLHRDLKPENIMLQGEVAGGLATSPVVKVLDFGLSILTDPKAPRITAAGVISGTAEYAAPEQMGDETLDERADLYGLGAIFYELLCCEAPFSELETPIAIGMAKIFEDAPPLPHKHPQLRKDGRIEELLFRLLARDRENRPRSADEVVRELELLIRP